MKILFDKLMGSVKSVSPALDRFLWRIRNRVPGNTISRKVRGKNNCIRFHKSLLNGVSFDIIGQNNRIDIADDCTLNQVSFHIRGDNHHITIGRNCRFNRSAQLWLEDSQCLLEIGEGSTFEHVHLAVTEPGSQIRIGRDCMFAYDIDVRSGDSHAILSRETGERINPARDVIIANHVWVAAHCTILKGVSIPEDCVVATGAVVTRSFDTPGIIIGGNPAKAIRSGITWGRERFPDQDRNG